MLNTRYIRFIGVFFVLLYGGITVAADESMQGWMLSYPKLTVNVNSKRQLREIEVEPQTRNYTRSEALYNVPNVNMVDKDGANVNLLQLTDYNGPLMIQFIFATCSTICPILSASFAIAQPELDALSDGVYRLISISIDPEQDTPEKLVEYAKRFKAGKNWYFLTGNQDDVAVVLKAFDASYSGNNKMYHQSLTLMRSAVTGNWVRIEGLLGRNEIISEYKKLISFSNPSQN